MTIVRMLVRWEDASGEKKEGFMEDAHNISAVLNDMAAKHGAHDFQFEIQREEVNG